DETSALSGLIPPDRLAKVCRNKSSNNPQQGCQYKTLGLVLVARMKESRDHSGQKPNYDGPKNAHCDLRLLVSQRRGASRRTIWRLAFEIMHQAVSNKKPYLRSTSRQTPRPLLAQRFALHN